MSRLPGLTEVDTQGSRQLGDSSTQLNVLRCYFVLVAIHTLAVAYHIGHSAIGWEIDDWLINYQAGFVRRGAVGEVIYCLHAILGIRVVPIVQLAQLSCYGVVLYTAYSQLRRHSGWSLWIWAILLSPATFRFQIAGPGGFRKEVLFFAGLSATIALMRMNVADWKIAALLTVWLPFTILSHEMLYAYIPYYPAALILSGRSYSRVVRMTALAIVLSTIAMFAAALHHGGPDMTARICSSIKEVEPPPCHDAIVALGQSKAEARAYTYEHTHLLRYKLIWCLTGLLAAVPIIVFIWRAFATAKTRGQARVVSATIAVSLFISLPIYYYGADWGRWIYIQILSVSLLILFMDWDHALPGLPFERVVKDGKFVSRAAVIGCLLAYATCWYLPHFQPTTASGIFLRIVQVEQRIPYLHSTHADSLTP